MVHERRVELRGSDGVVYDRVRVYGQPQDQVSWAGWIEFLPAGSGRRPLQTERETSQGSIDAIAYWATGLERIYLEGALERAERRGKAATPPAAPFNG